MARKWIKTVVTLLSFLLAFSLAALAAVLIFQKSAENSDITASAPGNLITPESACPLPAPTPSAGAETTIRLCNRQPQENAAFACGSLLPGDTETRYFRIEVFHKDAVTVHYHADIRPGYEVLAEVLKVRIVGSGALLYDGLMRDMPEKLSCSLSGNGKNELFYEITAYLDASVGNAYQGKELIADFCWWVEETGNLGPVTGDFASIFLWSAAAVVSGCLCLLLVLSYKRKGGKHHA